MIQPILPQINAPSNLKHLDVPQLAQLGRELRDYIIANIANTGGHLAPSLGVIELTLVLHYLFDTPTDKIVWDVGHQAYAHKIITGRREQFQTIRQDGGISGFPKVSESPYDAFGVGHASTAISAAYGMACARDLKGESHKIIAVVGDGALTGGLAFEGLNNAGAQGRDFIVVLNDNSMSISPNVGALSQYLTNLISNPIYNRIKSEVWDLTGKLSTMGDRIRSLARRVEEGLKGFIIPGIIFERLGFRYFGPIDGHNLSAMIHLFREIRQLRGPLLVHILTKKGKGFIPAERNATVFHGLGQFDPKTGEPIQTNKTPTFTQVFGETLVELGHCEPKLVAITAAMALGTGLTNFAKEFPKRFFDVGIAEGHAITFAAGLAIQGIRPVAAIYSSFLQRSYDQILHDVALQKLPVIIVLDRAGLVGDDGPTHHGVFDLAYLRTIPNLVVMAPKDEDELRQMLYTAVQYQDGPIAIRYPRGTGEGVPLNKTFSAIPVGRSEIVQPGEGVAILALGPLVSQALQAAQILRSENNLQVQVVNMRFLKPVDEAMLTRIAGTFKLVLTAEEGTIKGGFGSEVGDFLTDHHFNEVELIRLGIPDQFIEQGNRQRLLDEVGLSYRKMVAAIRQSQYYEKEILHKSFLDWNFSHH